MRFFLGVGPDVIDELVLPGEWVVYVLAVLPPAQKGGVLDMVGRDVLPQGGHLTELQSARLGERGKCESLSLETITKT